MEYYPTSDLGVACYLVSIGYEVQEMDYSSPRRVKFVFTKDAKLEKHVAEYWKDKDGKLSFYRSIKHCKDLLYAGLEA